MKAILINYSTNPTSLLLHGNVEQIPSVGGGNRQFRCKDCGHSWTEHIQSAQILSEDQEKHFEEYYGHCTIAHCTKTK